MTSHEQYIDIQRRLMRLYETGNELEPAQLERALDGLMGATRQMVRTRRREVSTPITPPGTPPQMRAVPMRRAPQLVDILLPADDLIAGEPDSPPPLRREPQLVTMSASEMNWESVRVFPAAELRPRAHIRPSELIRQIRAVSGVTMAMAAEPMEPQRMTWQRYFITKIKYRAIGKTRYEANCSEDCSICMDRHTNGVSVTTECDHCFGKECWEKWITNRNSNQKCPVCRVACPSIISYTLRAGRKSFERTVDDNA